MPVENWGTVPVPGRVLAAFWSKVEIGEPDECWAWRYHVGSHGYGSIGWSAEGVSRNTTAHRVAWMLAHGTPVPVGLTVDHLCRVRVCCNPAHLRLLSNVANASDNGMARRVQCIHGHAYTPDNTYYGPEGHRRCRTCARLAHEARRKRVSA